LLLLAAWRMKSRDVTVVAFAACVFVALCAVPVFLTGEPAADAVEGMAHVTHDLVHAHEEAAEPAFIAMLVAVLPVTVRNRVVSGDWAVTVAARPTRVASERNLCMVTPERMTGNVEEKTLVRLRRREEV